MKMKLIAVPSLIVAGALLSACTTAEPTASYPANDPRPGATAWKRTYTDEELRKRGEPTLGGALEKQDASVYVTGSR